LVIAVLFLVCSLPGTVAARVVYSIPRHGASLSINMSATTDKPTPLSMINHASTSRAQALATC
jgi:hypothetical protein